MKLTKKEKIVLLYLLEGIDMGSTIAGIRFTEEDFTPEKIELIGEKIIKKLEDELLNTKRE